MHFVLDHAKIKSVKHRVRSDYFMKSPQIAPSVTKYLPGILLGACFLIGPINQAKADPVQTTDLIENISVAGIKDYLFNAYLQVRGWKLGSTTYFGQTEIAGKTRLGLVIDHGQYAYGINRDMVSITYRF